jgi:Transposase IS4
MSRASGRINADNLIGGYGCILAYSRAAASAGHVSPDEGIVGERAREWTDLLVEELYVFLGIIIYMGIHEEPQIEIYWNTDFNKGPC